MMDILMSETCWAHKKWNKIASDIKWAFHSETLYSCASACKTNTTQNQPHQISNTQRTENKTTDVVIHQHNRKLLMMDILMSETCWTHKKWNKIASDIKWAFHSETLYRFKTDFEMHFKRQVAELCTVQAWLLNCNGVRIACVIFTKCLIQCEVCLKEYVEREVLLHCVLHDVCPFVYTEWPKKMYTLFTHQYLWNKFKWNFYFRVRV